MKSHSTKLKAATRERTSTSAPYAAFDRIDGSHSLKVAAPESVVEYQVRTRHGGRVVFFNFALAKEMGLIPKDHPETLNAKLERKLLETFSLVIINEYDIQKKIQHPPEDIRAHTYMATRYLQMQHPCKRGSTSGDGRGIWNGELRAPDGRVWDVSSSGTGATRLSPAAAQTGRNYRTGDMRVGYGSGYNTLDEGISAALMSEIFHGNDVATERTLVIIGFSGAEKDTSINVRAAPNLIRPSHLFCHLKQGRYDALKAVVDHYYDRQVRNEDWPKSLRGERRYAYLAERTAAAFARLSAQLELDYIFCWMDWDGDNILANAGIIDYGSVRQFGLYYGDYRYDDVDRYSTRLPEQRLKARGMVQVFAQIRDFLVTGRKRNMHRFRDDAVLKLFDQEFEQAYLEGLLRRVGYSQEQRERLLDKHRDQVQAFRKVFNYFERVRSKKGIYNLADGENRDAVFSMRELLREYPRTLLRETGVPLKAPELLELIAANKARPSDLKLTEFRVRKLADLQEHYLKLARAAAGPDATPGSRKERRVLLELSMRASVINQRERVTGNGAIFLTENMIRWHHRRLPTSLMHRVFRALVDHQTGAGEPLPNRSRARELLERSLRVIRKYSESV